MAVTKPTVLPEFALLDLLNGTAGAPNVVEPSSGKKDTGWNEGERPARETFNWLHRITNEWIEYFDCITLSSASVLDNFEEKPLLHSGLTFFIGAADFMFGGEPFSEVQTSVVLADDDVNFVYYDHDTLDTEFSIAAFPNTKRTIPLFTVTTAAGAITNVVDHRSWATGPDLNTSILDEQEIRTAGNGYDIVTLDQTDATPTPDCVDGNIFRYAPTSPTAIVVQNPLNPEALSGNQTQEIILLIALSTGDSVTWDTAYDFVDDRNGDGSILDFGGGDYMVRCVYDSISTWKCTIIGRSKNDDGGRAIRKFKPADESKAVTGVADDADLAGFALPIGRYRVRGHLTWNENQPVNGGLELDWQLVSGTLDNDFIVITSMRDNTGNPYNSQGAIFAVGNSALDTSDGNAAFNDVKSCEIGGTVEVTAAAVIDLQWAPLVASSLTIQEGSYIEFVRID